MLKAEKQILLRQAACAKATASQGLRRDRNAEIKWRMEDRQTQASAIFS
jgi:hypothetical protein